MPAFLDVQPTAMGEGDGDDGTSPGFPIWLCPGHPGMQGPAAMAGKGLGMPTAAWQGVCEGSWAHKDPAGIPSSPAHPRTLTVAG